VVVGWEDSAQSHGGGMHAHEWLVLRNEVVHEFGVDEPSVDVHLDSGRHDARQEDENVDGESQVG
jgi:hypothetical protein